MSDINVIKKLDSMGIGMVDEIEKGDGPHFDASCRTFGLRLGSS